MGLFQAWVALSVVWQAQGVLLRKSRVELAFLSTGGELRVGWKPRYSLMPDVWLLGAYSRGKFIPWELLHRIVSLAGCSGLPQYEEAYKPAYYPAGWQFEWKFCWDKLEHEQKGFFDWRAEKC